VVVRAQERAGGREAVCACVAVFRHGGGGIRPLRSKLHLPSASSSIGLQSRAR
jgi:hypothetical protein